MSRYLRRSRRRAPAQPRAVYCHCGKPACAHRYDDNLVLCLYCRAARAREEGSRDD